MIEKDLFELTGKVVIVTGGAGHLGTAMCSGLAKYGATVVIASRNVSKCCDLASILQKEYDSTVVGMKCDVTQSADIISLLEHVDTQFGHIDVVVNNANGSTPGYIDDFTDESWNKGINESINSVFRMTKAVLPYMVTTKNGSIINIASMYGVVAPNPAVYMGDVRLNNPANYGVGKAGIVQFTKYIAAYYGKLGIRCNAISPGPFPNPEVQANHEEFIGRLSDKTMLGRIGTPNELQGAIVFLASDASSFVTGHNLCVDGGWTTW